MKKVFLTVFLVILLSCQLYAAQSTIIDVEGNACMGDDKSRKQTEQAAMADAKRNASERAMTYLKSETQVKDFVVEKDLINAYAQATVKIIQELEKAWFKDANSGDCYRIRIRAEIVPDEKAMEMAAKVKEFADNPGAPLKVQLWTDKQEYKQGEKVKITSKGTNLSMPVFFIRMQPAISFSSCPIPIAVKIISTVALSMKSPQVTIVLNWRYRHPSVEKTS